MTRITLLVMITVASAVLAGATVLRSRPAPLAGTCVSPEALAAAVLDGFVRKDCAALVLWTAEKATWMAGEGIQIFGGNQRLSARSAMA